MRGAFFVWCSLAFWVVAITVSIAVTVAIAISVSISIAISVAVLAAVEGLFVIFDVIEDGAHTWEGVFFVEPFDVEEHAFVEAASTDKEAGVVGDVFHNVGIDHHAGGSAVEDDVFVFGTQIFNHLVETRRAEQLSRVGRQGAGEEGIDVGSNDVVLDEGVDVVFFFGEIVDDAGFVAVVELACQ